ncbi:hypothetical protein [sulfur-oxidizing endosymbiont of Gigantopelta aegis]|uniref:hypothetical protein n=1 Tax=sulfur-oxidizing endosymbiont of Gigantopelta aegis TaxID=2794934 RepID=UPI0018DC404A|nr:hypothetical protein [sulfur-oxidizing endosymbiont of Gigantopelta aegis]
MDTLTVIIIGVTVLLILDFFLISYLRKKRKDRFKIIIEEGIITQNSEHIPSEFLYDLQQLSRINKPDILIINGSGLLSKQPEMEFKGNASDDLKEKIKQSLILSLQ